jgi:hypothetical protein
MVFKHLSEHEGIVCLLRLYLCVFIKCSFLLLYTQINEISINFFFDSNHQDYETPRCKHVHIYFFSVSDFVGADVPNNLVLATSPHLIQAWWLQVINVHGKSAWCLFIILRHLEAQRAQAGQLTESSRQLVIIDLLGNFWCTFFLWAK